jgi:hypothetical protein
MINQFIELTCLSLSSVMRLLLQKTSVIQLLLFENFPLLAFFKAKFCLSFFSIRTCEAFEEAQQQSSSRLIKGFLSLIFKIIFYRIEW